MFEENRKTEVIITDEWYNNRLIDANPNQLFIFGDNMMRVGNGGQACIRNHPNTYGVATKAAPSMDVSAFFSDEKQKHMDTIVDDLGMLKEIMLSGIYNAIVFPESGLGTGLAKLKEKAPKTHSKMLEILEKDFKIIEVCDWSNGGFKLQIKG